MWVLRVVLLGIGIFQVSMALDPRLEIYPDNNVIKMLGKSVYASCSATVQDPELVTEMAWSGPNGEPIVNSLRFAVESDDRNNLNLLIWNLQTEDSGVYKCTAIYGGTQELTADFQLDYFMDIDFSDTPTHQTLVIHSDSKIRCNPVAKPAPIVDWIKDGKRLYEDYTHIIQPDGLLIKNVTEADEGVYKCRARVRETGSIKIHEIQVEVYIPPAIIIKPEDTKGIAKESATFECSAKGNPAVTYTWVDKDGESLQNTDGYFVDADKGSLTIMNLRSTHEGKYRCTATNLLGSDSAEANLLKVLTRPKVEEYLNITNRVDDSVEMRCVASGDPTPSIVFRKESNNYSFQNGINDDDRIEVKQQIDDYGRRVGILSIRDLQRRDDGLYTCTAESEGVVTQEWGHITVQFAPTFEHQPSSHDLVWSWQNAKVNLTCVATSIPNATIIWFHHNEQIDPYDSNLRVLAFGPSGVLQVDPVNAQYFGIYTCNAVNIFGSALHSIELRKPHFPGPVSYAKVVNKTARTITWRISDPIDNGGLPILGFRVQYRLQDLPWEDAQILYWPKGSSYTVNHLQPSRTYIFRFSGRNEAGDGEWRLEKALTMPTLAPPEEPLILSANDDGDVVNITDSDQHTFHWQAPLDNGEEIDYYELSYYQVQNDEGKWIPIDNVTSIRYEASRPTSYIIRNLKSNSHYKILLRAHNAIGFSRAAEIVIKTANGDAVPEQPGMWSCINKCMATNFGR